MYRHMLTVGVVALGAIVSVVDGEVIQVYPDGLPSDGWSVSGNGCNQFGASECEDVVYSDINAQIGDILLFNYGQFHDVFLHNSPELAQSCTFGTAGGTRVGTGGQGNQWDSASGLRGFQYELTEAGDFGFSCSRSGNRPGWPTIGRHCEKGQRVIVHVADPNAPPAGGETIVVGGQQGWVVKSGNAPYDDITANVGDTLQFAYSQWYHDVMLVDNENCDFTNGQMVDETGDFAWTIPEPGTYIFACSRGDHCSVGNQQVTVIVEGGDGVECVGDVTGDLVVDVNDLLQLLSAFGLSGENVADLDDDLVVDVNDLLGLLGVFGSTC